MAKNLIALTIGVVFAIGFFIGRNADVKKIIAQEGYFATPTATPSPTPISTPTPTDIPLYKTITTSSVVGRPGNDIVEVEHLQATTNIAQVGIDIGFSVTIKNQSSVKKNIHALCFNSTDGNFGCTRDFNLYPGQSFQFNNSGRFTTAGVKTVWVTWTQDDQNFYRPIDSRSITVTIQD